MKDRLLLSELNLLIQDALIEAFPDTVWVVAEISELKENRSGHCYLELIEKNEDIDDISARARATIWSYTYRMLKPYFETTTGQVLTSGIKVLVQASVEFHPVFGFSLNIKDIDPTYTIGDLARRRNEIIGRLKNEGVFDMNRELALPLVPQKIAVISSATAAGYQDFINQLENNSYGFVFYHQLFEAYMQGSEAVPSIIAALESIYQNEEFFDVVVIIRGGGAQADLSSFDNYELALNITQFPLPVLTGIGHEKDDTIIDMVAHTRLKTPTAVAEFLITGLLSFYENLVSLETQILEKVRDKLEQEEEYLDNLGNDFIREGQLFLQQKQMKLSSLGHELEMAVKDYSFQRIQQLNTYENRVSGDMRIFVNRNEIQLSQYTHNLKKLSGYLVLNNNNKLEQLKGSIQNLARIRMSFMLSEIEHKEKEIELLNPEGVLKRGYTLTYQDGKIIKSKEALNPKQKIVTRFADGDVESKIINSE